MKILLVTGIKEEINQFFKEHPFAFNKELGLYQSNCFDFIYAITSGPGLKEAGALKKRLMRLKPDIIINAGLVGILNEADSLSVGEKLRLGSVIDSGSRIIFPGGPGRDVLVTVPEPVFKPINKMNLHLDFKARVCDMEASKLIQLVGNLEEIAKKTVIVFIKVSGDRPEQYSLFKNEYLLRSWYKRNLMEKIITAFKYPGGPFRMKHLLKGRNVALQSLTKNIHTVLKRIVDSEGRLDQLDSVFIPH